MTTSIAVSNSCGALLDIVLGLPIWSGKDPSGLSRARIFRTEQDCRDFIDGNTTIPNDMLLVEVKANDAAYATMSECIAAGVNEWEPGAPPAFGPEDTPIKRTA